MKSLILSIDKGLGSIEKPLMVLNAALMFLLMTWAVIARVFGIPVAYQSELAQTFHIWLCFIGGSYLFSNNENPSVELFSDKVGKSDKILFKKCYFTLITLLPLVFIGPCLYYGIQNIPRYVAQTTIYLDYSYIYVYGAAIVGFALMTFRIFLRVAGYWNGLYLPEAQTQGGHA